MTIAAVADTHTIIWYLYGDARLSQKARDAFDDAARQGNQISLSAMSLAEIVYLSERGRIPITTLQLILTELNAPNGLLTETPVDRHVVVAMSQIARASVPELPDRVIAATALHLGVPIISRDGKIQTSGLITIW